MAITLIPYGQLANGRYGIKLDDSTGEPIVTALEVIQTLPLNTDPDNFQGRLMYQIDDDTLYVYQAGAINDWFPLEGIPSEVGAVAGSPPIVPTPVTGFLFYDTDTEVMFVWDATAWRPIGGRFAARYVETSTVSSGFAGPGGSTFVLGTNTSGNNEFAEVFLDGVRQICGLDYSPFPTFVDFGVPVPIGVRVFTRTIESTVLEDPSIVQNAQCITAIFNNQPAGITDFDMGVPGSDPSCVMVFSNGAFLVGGGVDYNVSTVDTTITTIIKTGATVAQVTCASAHGAATGDVVTIAGCTEPEYTGNFTISAIISPSVFEIPVVVTAPASCTQDDPGIPVSYSPPFVNDVVVLNVATLLGDDITIMTFQRIIVAPSTGEANTASNLGSGVGLFSTKTGVDLRFKSISGGSGILVTDGGGGTVSISADTLQTFESRVGINTSVYNLGTTESYIGVRNTGAVVTIDVSTVPGGTSGSGRRLVVQDESGGAGTNNIQITHAGALFGGVPSPFIINVDFASVTIVYDGNDWHIVSKTF